MKFFFHLPPWHLNWDVKACKKKGARRVKPWATYNSPTNKGGPSLKGVLKGQFDNLRSEVNTQLIQNMFSLSLASLKSIRGMNLFSVLVFKWRKYLESWLLQATLSDVRLMNEHPLLLLPFPPIPPPPPLTTHQPSLQPSWSARNWQFVFVFEAPLQHNGWFVLRRGWIEQTISVPCYILPVRGRQE